MHHILPEEQLIEYAKPYLKANGFKIVYYEDRYKELWK